MNLKGKICKVLRDLSGGKSDKLSFIQVEVARRRKHKHKKHRKHMRKHKHKKHRKHGKHRKHKKNGKQKKNKRTKKVKKIIKASKKIFALLFGKVANKSANANKSKKKASKKKTITKKKVVENKNEETTTSSSETTVTTTTTTTTKKKKRSSTTTDDKKDLASALKAEDKEDSEMDSFGSINSEILKKRLIKDLVLASQIEEFINLAVNKKLIELKKVTDMKVEMNGFISMIDNDKYKIKSSDTQSGVIEAIDNIMDDLGNFTVCTDILNVKDCTIDIRIDNILNILKLYKIDDETKEMNIDEKELKDLVTMLAL